RESRHPQPVMSALPPKADMCGAIAHVCFGPIADIVIDGAGEATLSDDPDPVGYDATGRSLLHLESVDGQLGIVRGRTRFDGWRRNVARGCTSTGVGGWIYWCGRYSFGRSVRGWLRRLSRLGSFKSPRVSN